MDAYTTDLEKTSRQLFPVYLGILFIAPFPLGASRPWAWGMLSVVVFLCILFYCFQYSRGKQRLPLINFKTKIILFGILTWLAYQVFQLVPLSNELMQQLNPFRASISENLDFIADSKSISIDRMNSLVEIAKSATYSGMFLLTLLLVNRRDRLRSLLLTVVVAGVCQAVIGLAFYILSTTQNLDVVGLYLVDSVKGTFINRNHFAGFLNMAIAASFGLLIAVGLREKRSIHRGGHAHSWQLRLLDWRVYLIFYAGLMVVAVIFSQSRGGWLAFGLMFIAALFIFSRQQEGLAGRYKEVSIVVIAIVIALVTLGGEMVVSRITNVSQDFPLRLVVWENSWQIIKENWITGVGAGNFQYIYPYFAENFHHKNVLHAHSDYLEILVEQGVVGVLLIGLVILLAILNALRVMLSVANKRKNAFAVASVLATVGFLVHATVDFNFQVPSNALYFFVFLAVATIQGEAVIQEEKRDVAWEEAIFEEPYEPPPSTRRHSKRRKPYRDSFDEPLSDRM